MFGLAWNILCKQDVLDLVSAFNARGLYLEHDIDWATNEAVINPTYCSPFPGISYTFGLLKFVKR